MKTENVIFSRKEFLNLPGQEGMANIVAHIVKEDYNNRDKLYRNTSITLDIADCDRKISLDFYTEDGDEYDMDNAIHKVETLIDVLKDFKKALKKEHTVQRRLAVRRKAKEEKENE